MGGMPSGYVPACATGLYSSAQVGHSVGRMDYHLEDDLWVALQAVALEP